MGATTVRWLHDNGDGVRKGCTLRRWAGGLVDRSGWRRGQVVLLIFGGHRGGRLLGGILASSICAVE